MMVMTQEQVKHNLGCTPDEGDFGRRATDPTLTDGPAGLDVKSRLLPSYNGAEGKVRFLTSTSLRAGGCAKSVALISRSLLRRQ